MKKSMLTDDTPILVIKVRHFVRKTVFVTALTNHFYGQDLTFDKNLKKKEALKILYDQLFFYGIQGEYHDGFFEAATDAWDKYDKVYKEVNKWVTNNYPYLNQNNNGK